ncbi:hypothetical protein LTS08_008681 [Lithohypha guttulata]|nr:hypothetical protein LTS08_008681 [Lithohypha guttulata]
MPTTHTKTVSISEPEPTRPVTQQHASEAELDRLATVASTLAPYPVAAQISFAPAEAFNEAVRNISSVLTNSTTNVTHASLDDDANEAHGTLMLSREGRSKYLGPTAGSEWLKDLEYEQEIFLHDCLQEMKHRHLWSLTIVIVPGSELFALFIANLTLFSHDVAPKETFQKTFDRVYSSSEGPSLSPSLNPQEIALVFIVFAQGTMYNIEMPHCDASVEDWLNLSEKALVKGEFLSNNMIPGLQTLHLMCHLHLHLDKGRRGDNAWPLWGLVMRLIQAMGMHRDGTCWNLAHDVVEERRKVFWECNAADIFQAHCFSRPAAINPEHCDTAYPSEQLNLEGEKSYFRLRFELSQLSSEILSLSMKIRRPSYADVVALDRKLAEFEMTIPFSLRCRAAFLSMPSRYPRSQAAIDASPEPSRRSMRLSFQQMNLAFNISETFINLHRPYYAKALYEDIDDRLKSVYAQSFLAVIERCTILISITTDIFARFPAVSLRQWNLWFHCYNSALCLGTLLMSDPANVMSAFILEQIDAAVGLFNSLIQHGAGTPRYRRNLEWLLKLRARGKAKIAAVSTQKDRRRAQGQPASEEREEAEDVELLGWRTRLIERAGQNQKIIRTIRLAATTPTGSAITNLSNPPPNVDEGSHYPDISLDPTIAGMPLVTPDSTNDLLQDFWEPMLLQNVFEPMQHNATSSVNNSYPWWDDSITQGMNQPR